MSQDTPIYTGYDAVHHLVEYCSNSHVRQFTLVSDTNTYRALGKTLEAELKQAGLSVISIILEGDVPSPANPPVGCNFNTRCPVAIDACFEEEPVFKEISPEHWTACYRVG